MTTEDTNTSESRMWDIAKATDICMFVTMEGKRPWARPMSTVVRAEERRIYLLTDRHSVKDDHIKANPNVVLAYGNNPAFLTIRGVAKLSSDRKKVEELWSPGAQVFWPDGPTDPNVVVIEVSPHEAEYWDGDNRLVSMAKFAWAIATGTTISPGENKKIRLSASPVAHSVRGAKNGARAKPPKMPVRAKSRSTLAKRAT